MAMRIFLAALIMAVAVAAPALRASVIAYNVAAGTLGNQDVGGESLGMDFDANAPIIVTHLGVFDDGSNGLAHPLTAQMYNRDTGLAVSALTTFGAGTGAASGTLIGGSRFLAITPLVLPLGFHGTIAASHEDSTERNFNSFGSPNLTATTDTGGGLISFVGSARTGGGVADVFPAGADGGPANRYDSGTFMYQAVPEPSGLVLVGIATIALAARRRPATRRSGIVTSGE
jgi:hypothetical protein